LFPETKSGRASGVVDPETVKDYDVMKIGVSGASGHLGTAILNELVGRRRGHEVIGISRNPENLSAPVSGRFGDYDNPESLAGANAGLDRLLIIPTMARTPGVRGRQTVAAIDAAVAAGVGHIVIMSGGGTRAAEEPNILASYYAGEQRPMRTAPRWNILRMNYYAESLIDEAKTSLGQGVLAGLAENKVALVSRDDLAAAAAGLLVGEGHEGAIYNGTGPASISGAERAEAIAAAARRPMTFMVLPKEVLRGGLEQAGLPADVVNVVISIQEAFAAGGFDIVTGDIEKLSGKAPRAFKDVLRQAFA
jgi:NAD(P)H dehydrogenase (quinone)